MCALRYPSKRGGRLTGNSQLGSGTTPPSAVAARRRRRTAERGPTTDTFALSLINSSLSTMLPWFAGWPGAGTPVCAADHRSCGTGHLGHSACLQPCSFAAAKYSRHTGRFEGQSGGALLGCSSSSSRKECSRGLSRKDCSADAWCLLTTPALPTPPRAARRPAQGTARRMSPAATHLSGRRHTEKHALGAAHSADARRLRRRTAGHWTFAGQSHAVMACTHVVEIHVVALFVRIPFRNRIPELQAANTGT